MRYLVVIYTVFMLIVMGVVVHDLSAFDILGRDMVYYNEQLKKVEQKLQETDDVNIVEQKYSCDIFFLTDSDYEAQLNEQLQEGAVVFDYYEDGEIIGKVAWNEEKRSYQDMQTDLVYKTMIILGIILSGGYLLIAVIYVCFIRPFKELQEFSTQIAKGNFDFPLLMRKHNFFGAFTESFDIMREELKRARESEYQANQSKKELVAELSHDIKTPISTIKATCEVMQIKEHNPDTLNKIEIIAAKADMVNHLIGNMFHATLEELEALKVEVTEESSICIVKMLKELKYYGEIILLNEMPECLVYIDKIRLEQIIDNIINNSYKYAGTTITVLFKELDHGIGIKISDKGEGVPDEEIALITEKFYRGSNTKGKDGSGLGLYLSKIFIQQMQGGLECYNQDGFVVELFIRKV